MRMSWYDAASRFGQRPYQQPMGSENSLRARGKLAGAGRRSLRRRCLRGRCRPWVPTASLLHSNGDAMDIAVKDGLIVGVRGIATDRVDHGCLDVKDLYAWQASQCCGCGSWIAWKASTRRGCSLSIPAAQSPPRAPAFTLPSARDERRPARALLHELITHDWIDHKFLDAHTVGFDELRQRTDSCTLAVTAIPRPCGRFAGQTP